jgi:hypothetical protein
MKLRDRWRQRVVVRAVADEDLSSLLEKLGLLDEVVRGVATCHACGRSVNLSSIGCVFANQDGIHLGCTAGTCCASAMRIGGRE